MHRVGLAILLTGSILAFSYGPSTPEWCDGPMTAIYNSEYGYELYYPEASYINTPENSIYMSMHDDDVSTIHISVYETTSYFTPAKLLASFQNNIQDAKAPEPGEFRLPVERYDYETVMLHDGDPSYHDFSYLCTYDYAGWEAFDEGPFKVRVRGTITWLEAEWLGETYIYEIQYETRADCEECIYIQGILEGKTLMSIYPR